MSRRLHRLPSAEGETRLAHRDPRAVEQWSKPLKSVCVGMSRVLSPLPAAARARIYSSSEPAGGLGGERRAAPQPQLGEEKML